MDDSCHAFKVGAHEESGSDATHASAPGSQLVQGSRRDFFGRSGGLNNKVKVVTRKSYGFRSTRVMKLALFHTLGQLPEPIHHHRFC